MIRLLIFDVDGTLVKSHTLEMLPHVRDFFQQLLQGRCELPETRPALALATNQGGVGMRYWAEQTRFSIPKMYPSEAEVNQRLSRLAAQLCGGDQIAIYVSYRYQDRRGKWSPVPPEKASDPHWSETWRKPAPGMLRQAMIDAGASPAETLFVGDRLEDQAAARAAGCHFAWARDFFDRDWNNREVIREILP